HCNSACYGAGLWLDFPLTVLLTVPDFMGGSAAYGAAVLLLATRRSRKNDAGGRKHQKISL
ncbi:hypothetical protein OU639_25435, partial [Escherichia coli]|nr:hypothetical protein [Escherichia coli]